MNTYTFKKSLINIFTLIVSLIVIFVLLELGLRLKNYLIIDYDVEMWRYSKNLKIEHQNKSINHIHIKNSSSKLQNVEININSLGMRGKEDDINEWQFAEKKLLFIGSSIMLGWGVEDKDVLNKVLEREAQKNNLNWKTLNAAVGNYNTERYVSNFFEFHTKLQPDIILIQYFINDAEKLSSNKGNFFTRNFHLGVMLWRYFSLFKDDMQKENIEDFYKKVYSLEKKEKTVKSNLNRLNKYCVDQDIRCILIFTPDIELIQSGNDLNFINDYIYEIANEIEMELFDLSKIMKIYLNQNLTNKKYNDRHPNSLAHRIIGEELFKFLIN